MKISAPALALAAGAMHASALAAPAAAPPCGLRSEIVTQLTQEHDEQQVAIGLSQQGQVLELWAGPNGGWTLLASLPTGISCIMALGERLEFKPFPLPGAPT